MRKKTGAVKVESHLVD